MGTEPPNVAHQPPTICATSDEPRVATTSPNHRWPDTTVGKFTPPRDATQAPDPSERGAVDGRLHALVGRIPRPQAAALKVTPSRPRLKEPYGLGRAP